jgi:hypothetical protein
MAKAKAKPKNVSTAANVLEVLSLLVSVSVLAAITQHVDHLSQLSTQLVATATSQGTTDYVNVGPDFQLVPLVPLAIIIFITTLERETAGRIEFSLKLSISSCIEATLNLLGAK